jgi:nucleoside-diphosphate-sugar epimerase
MRVFLTGATGFIGSHIVPELVAAGHHVIGMTRSVAGTEALLAAGAEPYRADLTDLDSLAQGAAQADAVIHTAFDHDFNKFAEHCAHDRDVIRALSAPLAARGRPLIITSGTGLGDGTPGEPATEHALNKQNFNPRVATELEAEALLATGSDIRVVRLPQVHDRRKQGLISPYIEIARAHGVAAYVGDGANRWCAAHVSDVAKLFVRVLERGTGGARYHAVAEESIPFRAIAEAVANGLGVKTVSLNPDQLPAHFGPFAMFPAADLPASGRWTRAALDWTPSGPSLIDDLRAKDYARAAGHA